ncbi:MAG: aspartyl protease family protein [Acidobacteriaceae bacterium]|nr:aspartyl protease family protein [Acidobacteriaceae bacterium]
MRSLSPWLWLCVLASQPLGAQTAGAPAPQAAHHSCSVTHGTVANTRLLNSQEEIDALFHDVIAKAQPDPILIDRIVDSEMKLHKVPEALARAQALSNAFPANSEALVELGEVKMRMGYLDEVVDLVNHAIQLDTCNPWAHYAASRYLELNGMYAKARTQLKMAHTLAPDDPMISHSWERANSAPKTPEETIAKLKEELAKPDLTEERKSGITFALKAAGTMQHGDCRVVNPLSEMVTKMLPMSHGIINTPYDIYGLGLEVTLNNKKRRFLLDTGASGLLLSRSAAVAAGLTPEFEVKTNGIGDDGAAASYVTHVDDIKIGSLEFKNCIVRVLEQGRSLDVDGLIGTDVFKDYLVTVDFPQHQLRLSPLPLRPGETAGGEGLSTGGLSQDSPWQRQDRYVAPEMKDWDEAFRKGHLLIVPTSIGNAPLKLFVLDSGADRGMISPEAAKLVTGVAIADDHYVRGLSGKVKTVKEADRVMIAFAGVKQMTEKMTSIDLTRQSQSTGVEISGFIGFPTLRQVTLAIDYRDNLIHVTYDPKHDGFH